MADADEDVIRPTIPSADDGDGDADEAQDFRFLAKLSNAKPSKPSQLAASTSTSTAEPPSTSTSLLPKRGTKDFEPVPTNQQATALAASRQAMHDALAHERFHAPRSHVRGTYDPNTGRVLVERSKGSAVFSTIGRGVRGGLELLPEEALWLVERGSLDVRWPAENTEPEKTEGSDKQEQGDHGVPMSVQGAYATLLGQKTALTLERYQVYAHLKRAGFIVLRPDSFDGAAAVHEAVSVPQTPTASPFWHKYGLVGWIRERFFAWSPPSTSAANAPLIQPGVYRSYDDIHQRLRLIPTRRHLSSPHTTNTDLTPTYNLYTPRPDTPFRKTSPGTPDFQVCVLCAGETRVPTLSQLTSLLARTSTSSLPPPAPSPKPIRQTYKALKSAQPSILLAVVDTGVISYVRVGEAPFEDQDVFALFEAKGRAAAAAARASAGKAKG